MREKAKKKKEYKIPQELVELFDEMRGLEYLRDQYIEMAFGFNKAKKCATKAEKLRSQVWRKVYQLYPRLKGKAIEYFYARQAVMIQDK